MGLLRRRAFARRPHVRSGRDPRGQPARASPGPVAGGAGRPRPGVPAALLAVRGMVLPGRRPRGRHPLLSRASAPGAPGREADPRGRRRHARVVPQDPAPRGGPRHRERVPPAPAAAAPVPLRPQLGAVPEVLPAPALQPQLRGPPRRVLRAEPPGRGLRGDLRRLAHPRIPLAGALRGLARPAQARIRGRAHARAGRSHAPGADAADGGSSLPDPQDPARALSREAAALRARPPEGLRRGPAAPLHRAPRRSRSTERGRVPLPQSPLALKLTFYTMELLATGRHRVPL